jgi:hypothetical protein
VPFVSGRGRRVRSRHVLRLMSFSFGNLDNFGITTDIGRYTGGINQTHVTPVPRRYCFSFAISMQAPARGSDEGRHNDSMQDVDQGPPPRITEMRAGIGRPTLHRPPDAGSKDPAQTTAPKSKTGSRWAGSMAAPESTKQIGILVPDGLLSFPTPKHDPCLLQTTFLPGAAKHFGRQK